MSYAPRGAIERAVPLEIKFDKPVVDEDRVGKPADPDAVTITPAVAWKGFWQDRQTLTIEATAPLASSTRYSIALAGDLARRTSGFHFEVVHRPLAVEGVWGVNTSELALDAAIPLSFNQPVRPADAAAHCRLVGGQANYGEASTYPDIALVSRVSAPGSQIPLVPAEPLVAGHQYTLTCSDLAGADGNVTLDKPYTLQVAARAKLAATVRAPTGTSVTADQARFEIAFSTPVTLDAARKAISSKPAIPGLAEGYLGADGRTYHATVDLESLTQYELTIADLTDTYGQRLPAPVHESFHTDRGQARISMQTGIYAVEASAKGYPVWTRNISKYTVACAALPTSKLVQVLTTDMSYSPWGYNDDAGKPLDWGKLGIRPLRTTRAPNSHQKWQHADLDLGATCGGAAGKRGVYLADISSDDVAATSSYPRDQRVLANVTDLGIVLEVGEASGIAWVTTLSTGEPVAGAQVHVFRPDGKLVYSDVTSSDGLVKIPSSAVAKQKKPPPLEAEAMPEAAQDWETNYTSQRLIVTAETAGDLAVVDGNWSSGIQSWSFGVRQDHTGGATKIRGFIQSDRGLYRPGETVHFKGLVREIAQGQAPRVPAGKAGRAPVAVEVSDSRGQAVLSRKAQLSSFGGFTFDLPLGAEAALGDYYVAATVNGQVFRERFSVEEFRPATFELGLRSTVDHPRPGDALGFAVDARYLFGAPVADAKVEWTLRKRRHVVQFEGWDDFTFGADPYRWWSWWYEPREDYGEQVSDGKGQTDAQGTLAIETRDSAGAAGDGEGDDAASRANNPVDYILSSSVTDPTDQTMTKSVVIAAHRTKLYLGMHSTDFVHKVGEPFAIDLVALDPDGKRVATKAKLSITRTVYECAWSTTNYRSYRTCENHQKPTLERELRIAASGPHAERIVPSAPGDYTIKIEATDGDGNHVVSESELWVIGKGQSYWGEGEGDRMTVIPSKRRYKPGDTARLVAQANLVAPTALITIERDGVIDARVQRMPTASEGIEIPIEAAWAPNVFARVAMVSGRHGAGDANRPAFKMGLTELAVAAAHKQLDVAVALDQAKVRPGDKVTGKITVRHDGAPVAAEVSLSVADEGILQLIAYQTPDPMKTFYAPYGLGVDASTNWNRLARIADPEASDPDQGGDAASSNDAQRVRSKFVSSAFWAPMLVTDGNGEIAFSFTAPDNLTAFRLMAVAADAGDQFGAGEQRLTIAKPLMATPALPRFLRGGDAAAVGVVIHNYTERAGRATVTAKATGATLDAATQTVDVPGNGAVRVRFAAKASDTSAATFEFAVALGHDHDALRVTLPIDRPRLIEHRLLVDRALAAKEAWTTTLAPASGTIRDASTLAITVDPTGIGDLAPSLRSLIEYPYGCLEQTMSRFIPLVAAKDIARTLDDPSLQGTRAADFIRAGVAKVIRHQQADGLFSLWPSSQTYPHLAAYALWGLTVAQQAGETVPKEVFDRGITALSTWANQAEMKPDGDAGTMAMAAYVMALRHKPDAALVARLYGIRTALPRWGQAFLLRAMALGKSDPAQIKELEQVIVSELQLADGKATAHETITGYDYELYMTSDVRATAMTLAALVEVDPKSALIEPLVAGLKASRTVEGSWVSTQENLWSLVALATYGKHASHNDLNVTVRAGDQVIASKHLLASQPTWSWKVALSELKRDQLAVTADRPAHLTARLAEARVDPGDAVSHGFTIERAYLDAAGKPATSIKAGDLVMVQLDITVAEHRRWVALVDPIPAGLEPQNPRLASGAADPTAAQAASDPWSYAERWRGEAVWVHQNLRDDRVEWFADDVPAGNYRLSYLARATIDGTFAANPATIEAMYQPDVHARTARSGIFIAK
ncbi:MAG TPA: MG2 domain-containing protein [Kofleriaceae bacterium]|nr:MG2 domain-containing protein [Kofleriaceae bacterium]